MTSLLWQISDYDVIFYKVYLFIYQKPKTEIKKLTITVLISYWVKYGFLDDFFDFGAKKCWRHHFLADLDTKFYISGNYLW